MASVALVYHLPGRRVPMSGSLNADGTYDLAYPGKEDVVVIKGAPLGKKPGCVSLPVAENQAAPPEDPPEDSKKSPPPAGGDSGKAKGKA